MVDDGERSMSEAEEGDKTEEPTPKRREEFRERGEVAKSQELSAALMLVGMTVCFPILAWYTAPRLLDASAGLFAHLDSAALLTEDPRFVPTLIEVWLLALLPVVGLLTFLAVFAHVVQFGPLLAWKALAVRPEKFNPFKGFQQKFLSAQMVASLVRTLMKLLLLGTVGVVSVIALLHRLPGIVGMSPLQFGRTLVDVGFYPFAACAAVMLLVGFADLAWQRYTMEKKMRMSRQETRREMRDTEGDPHQQARRKARARELAGMNRMLAELPTADLVVVNPTHYSVALRYRSSEGAPVVVAKGVDRVALRIRTEAARHNVPVLVEPELARTLHRDARVGQPIPADFYRAVARVLAVVLRRRPKRSL
jgi:flagellar biosynthetic protein FlhB